MRILILLISILAISPSAFSDVTMTIDPEKLLDSERLVIEVDKSSFNRNSQTAAIYREKTVYDQPVRELLAIVPVVTGKVKCLDSRYECQGKGYRTPKLTEVSPTMMTKRYRGRYDLQATYAMFLYYGYMAAAASEAEPRNFRSPNGGLNGMVLDDFIDSNEGLTKGSIVFLKKDIEIIFEYAKKNGKESVVFTVQDGINENISPRIK